jgi:hypothetical protein
MSELPLAAAQRRLGKPGRPRQSPAHQAGAGHPSGAKPLILKAKSDANSLPEVPVPRTVPGLSPRLLTFEQAAQYLNLSIWTFETLEQGGIVARVRVPLPGDGEVRKRLYDRADLDELIERWKARGG